MVKSIAVSSYISVIFRGVRLVPKTLIQVVSSLEYSQHPLNSQFDLSLDYPIENRQIRIDPILVSYFEPPLRFLLNLLVIMRLCISPVH